MTWRGCVNVSQVEKIKNCISVGSENKKLWYFGINTVHIFYKNLFLKRADMYLNLKGLYIYRQSPVKLPDIKNIIYQCMTSIQELIRIHNNSAHKSWSKYTTDDKVGKVNLVNVTCKTNPKSEWFLQLKV